MKVLGPAGALLTESHRIDIVVHQRRTTIMGGKISWNVEAIPTDHDRRTDDTACCELYRSRHRHSNSTHVARKTSSRCQQPLEELHHLIENHMGTRRDI